MTLPVTHIASCGANNDLRSISYACVGTNFEVGYHYLSLLHSDGLQFEDVVSRLAMVFDVASLRGRTIVSARLNLDVSGAWDNASNFSGDGTASVSCAARVGMAGSTWWTSSPHGSVSNWIDGSMQLDPGQSSGPKVSIDVTPIVKAWAEGHFNNGFLIEGQSENLNIDKFGANNGSAGADNGTCMSNYTANPTLVVAYTGGELVSPAMRH
jgi:hypothetical protein